MVSQLRNVLHKTWLLKRRAPLGLCCELLVPLLVIGAMALGYMVSATSVVPAGNYEQVLVWPEDPIKVQVEAATPTSVLDLLAALTGPGGGSPPLLDLAALPLDGEGLTPDTVQALLSALNRSSTPANTSQSDATALEQLLNGDTDLSSFLSSGGVASSLRDGRVALCTSFGVCLGVSLPGSFGDLFSTSALGALLVGVMPIPPFDAFVLIQKFAEERASDQVKRAVTYVPWIANLIKRRKIAFAPDTPQVRAAVRWMNRTSVLFSETFLRIFPTETDAVSWATGEGEDKLWALVVFRKIDAAHGKFDYTIRMNQSATPSTLFTTNRFPKGREQYYQQYLMTGFLSIQHLVEGYLLSLTPDRQLGTGCAVQAPAILLDSPANHSTAHKHGRGNATLEALQQQQAALDDQDAALLAEEEGLAGRNDTNATRRMAEIDRQRASIAAQQAALASLADALAGAPAEPAPPELNEDRVVDGVAAIAERLPKNVTDFVPGLRDNTTGRINKAVVRRLVRGFSSPANAFSLPLPVLDFNQNLFFTFAASFIGICGVFAYLYPAAVAMRTITLEKELRIKQGMLIMGLSPDVLWLSWVITNSLIAAATSLFITVEMKLTFLRHVNPFLLFLLNLLLAQSIVAFGLLCTTFFGKARNAAIVGPLLVFCLTIPTFAVQAGTPRHTRIAVSLLSPVAYSWGIDCVMSYEFIGRSLGWNQFFENGEYNVGISIIMMAADTVLYLLLAWYLDRVLPTANGVHRSACFCVPNCLRRLLPRRLLPRRRSQRLVEELPADLLDGHLFERALGPADDGRGIRMANLRKTFPNFFRAPHVAVDGLSLRMHENQINVVLGHNGAGKTTTINMMTGLLSPSGGDCSIYGLSIRTHMDQIRKSLGLCPQHDILWASLSVAEHLRFYARLKGMPDPEVEEAVQASLRDIGLEDNADAWSCTLSGGMKRRLSVGISLIGGSKVVFLDEPTSGMDPAARRQTWDLLRRAKAQRVLVLTTHFMDEADLLGDTIAIMSKGRLRCCGSPLFLKARLGAGYNLTFDLAEHADRLAIREAILEHAPTASPLSEVAGECSYKLPMAEAPRFPALFAALEHGSPLWGIQSFGMSLTTIEEVFLKVASEPEEAALAPAAAAAGGAAAAAGVLTEALLARLSSFRQPSRDSVSTRHVQVEPASMEAPELSTHDPLAGLHSPTDSVSPSGNPLLGSVDGAEAALACVSPVGSPIVAQASWAGSVRSDGGTKELVPAVTQSVHQALSRKVVPASPSTSSRADPEGDLRRKAHGLRMKGTPPTGPRLYWDQTWISLRKRAECAVRDRRTVALQILMPTLTIALALLFLTIQSPQQPRRELTMAMYPGIDKHELVVRDCGWWEDARYWPGDVYYDLQEAPNSAVLSNYSLRTFMRHHGLGYRAGGVVYKDTVAYLHVWRPNTSLPPELDPDADAVTVASAKVGVPVAGASLIPMVGTTFLHNTTAYHGLPTQFNALNEARLQQRAGRAGRLRAENYPLPLTGRQQQRWDSVITVVAATFVLIPFSFFPANCVAFIVKEREVKAKHLQMLSGLRPAPYWVACYVFDNLTMLVASGLTILMFAAFGRVEIVGTPDRLAAAVLLFVLYGLSSIALGYLCSFAFSSHSMAQNVLMLVNFLFGFVLVLMAQVLNSIPTTRHANEKLMQYYRLIPAYCLGEGIIRLSVKTVFEFGRGRTYSVWSEEIVGPALRYMAVMTPFLFIAVLFWDSEQRILLQGGLVRGWALLRAALRWGLRRAPKLADPESPDADLVLNEDEDVAHERLLVQRGAGRPGDKVTVQHLRKTYPKKGNAKPKTAVHDLSFGVPPNEIFALLGSNGAGKTTTLSIATGEMAPTAGRILLGGHDIEAQRRLAQSTTGYCPQFDALLDHLSVGGHLWLIGRLRGIPAATLPGVVDDVMAYLGLAPHRHKSAMNLSGGNKRKLSIGLAVIGSPDVVFLDEPSSGLDPVSRRSLWTCISDLAHQRAIILTTHHLEEADALAHRVTIMAHGQMRCLGTLQHLKSKFGDGYTMQFRVPAEQQEPLEEYLAYHFPASRLEQVDFGRLCYHLPSTTDGRPVKMSEIFACIQKAVHSFQIADYSVSQTTLQDVFLRLTADPPVPVEGAP